MQILNKNYCCTFQKLQSKRLFSECSSCFYDHYLMTCTLWSLLLINLLRQNQSNMQIRCEGHTRVIITNGNSTETAFIFSFNVALKTDHRNLQLVDVLSVGELLFRHTMSVPACLGVALVVGLIGGPAPLVLR